MRTARTDRERHEPSQRVRIRPDDRERPDPYSRHFASAPQEYRPIDMTSRLHLLRAALRIPPSYVVFVGLLATLWVLRPNMMNVALLGTFARQLDALGIFVVGQLRVA